MKRITAVSVLILCMVLLTSAAFAQVDVTATGGTLNASYTTLKGAFDAINAGTHTGTITIDISGDTNEGTATALLNASGTGSASYTAINMQPIGGAARTISGATTAGSPMIDLNGADNVTINGLNTGGNSLTIANTTVSATSITSTIRFIGGATNNVITNCNVQGSGTMSVATNGAVIFFSTDALTANGNDNNTISNCNIGPAGANLPTKGILGNGSTTTTAIGNSGIIINNNNFIDIFGAAVTSAGIALNGGCNTWTITNNRFYQTGTRTWTTGALHNGMNIGNSTATSGSQGHTITGNIIGYASNTQTGTYTLTGSTGKFVGIQFSGITGATVSTISNNTVASVSLTGVTSSGTTTSSPLSGITISNGVVNSNNNTIGSQSATGSLTLSTTTTTSTDVYGMFNNGSDNWTANSNNIGGISVTNAGASGTFLVYGMRGNTSSSVSFTGTSNSVGGTVANSIQLSATGTSSQVIGIAATLTSGLFTSNTVRNLTSNIGTGTGTGASVIGISTTTSTPNHTLSQNTIHTLTNTNATAASVVTGIQFTGASANVVERNLIYGLTAATNSATAEVNGIRVGGGTTTYRNNMIAVGAGIANAIPVNGINEPAAGTDNFYHNSVYIGGSPTAGSAASYAFNSTQVTVTRAYRDNIFFNARSNSGATGSNYAVRVGGTAPNPAGLTINNNVYFANGTGGVFGSFNSLDVPDLPTWKTNVGQDAASFSANPEFNDPTNAIPDLHLHPTNSTVAEGNGVDVGVTDDYDGQTRSGLTPVDIGADAGNFTGVDLVAPAIGYTTLANTASTSNRTLSSVTITDNSGVAGDPNRPRIYYKKSVDPNDGTGWKSVAANELTSPYSFTIDYSLLTAGSVTAGDVIQYFVTAQDVPGNVGAVPSGGFAATDVNTVTTYPTAPNSYSISTAFSGSYDVGATAPTYTTLKSFFDAVNAGVVTGNITVNVIDNTTETATASLSQWTEEPASSNFTMKVIPAGTPRPGESGVAVSISGNVAGALVRLNGADRVTFDGDVSGARSLTISNTNTGGTAVTIENGSVNSAVKSSILEGSNTSSTSGVVVIGAGTNSTDSLHNNEIRPSSGGVPANLIYSSSSTSASNVISDNDLHDWTGTAVLASSAGSDWSITGNNLYQTASRTTALTGINLGGGGNGHTVSNNSIGGAAADRTGSPLTTSSTFTGITISAGSGSGALVQGNTLGNILLSSTISTQRGIVSTGGNVNIWANLIGTAATHDSITSLNILDGIANTGSGTVSIKDNVVRRLTFNNPDFERLSGIFVSSGIATIEDNIIRDLTHIGSSTTGVTSVPVGISLTSSSAGHSVKGNEIFNISQSSTGQYQTLGIYVTSVSSTGTPTTITANKIYDLVPTGTTTGTTSPQVWGIYVSSGSATYANNMISLGATVGNEVRVNGMQDLSTGTNNWYHNSVSISGATAAGTNRSYAFHRSGTSTVTVKNNILVNTRTGGGGNLAIANTNAAATNWAAGASNQNILNGSDTTALAQWLSAGSLTNLGTWMTNSSGDAATVVGNPGFTGANDLHIDPTVSAIAANNGTPLVGIVDVDFDNDARSATTPDRGADEFALPAPGAFSLLSPADAATGVLLSGNLTWSSSQYASGYDVYLDTNPSPTTLVSSNQPGTTYAYSGLSVTTTYYWKVVAKNVDSTTTSSTFSFTTVGNLPPADPTDLVIGPVTHTQAALAWTDNAAAPDNDEGYRVYRATAIGGPYTNVSGDLDSNTVAYVATGLTPNTEYFFRVVAFNSLAGESNPASEDTTTLAETPGAPTLSDPTLTSIKTTLDPVGNPAATQFGVRVSFSGPEVVKYLHTNGTLVDTVVWGTYTGFGGASGKVMTGLTSNTSYTVDVEARNADLIETAFGGSSSLSTLTPLSGTYTVGSAQASPFNTLTGAVARLNAVGVSAAVTFELEDALYSGSETFPISINQFAGGSAVNTLTIKPAAGNNAVIQGSSSTSIIKLNGADYVTIDGSNNGSSSRNLTIQNNSASALTAAVWVSSLGASVGATDNTIKNCIIRAGANGTAGNTYGVYAAGTSITTTGTGAHNHNLVIQNNQIQKAYTGIYAAGATSGNFNTGLQIKDNVIGADVPADYITFRGMRVDHADGALISKNRIYNIISGESVVIRGIQCEAVFTNSTVDGNVVHDILNTTTTGFVSGQGISVSTTSATTANVTVSNNVIYNLNGRGSGTNTNNSWGIITFTGNGFKLYHNSISLTGAGTTTSSTDRAGGILINSSVTNTVDVRDNAFYITQAPGNLTTGERFAVYSATAAGNFTDINYNDYYVSGARSRVGFLGSSQVDLTAWQTATTKDAQSIDTDPLFNSPTANLRPQSGSPLVSAGFNVGTAQDALGVTRGDPPTIGAYEQAGDFNGPAIVYTPLTNTSVTGARTLNATITDASGVPTAGIGLPRLSWRINAGSYSSATAAHLGGSSYQFSFGAGAIAGDQVSYYVAAQDLNDNVSVAPSSGAAGLSANPPTAATAPSAPSSYLVTDVPLSGDFLVGSGAFAEVTGINVTFEKTTRKVMREVPVAQEATRTTAKQEGKQPELTASEFAGPMVLMEVEEEVVVPMVDGKVYDGPLYRKRVDDPGINLKESLGGVYATLTAAVADLNLRGVGAATRFLLTDSAYSTSETFPITIQIASDSLPTATNTVTIKPDSGKTPIITGAVTGDRILRVYNTPYVIIDGSNTTGGTTRDMTLENSHASASGVVRYGSVGTTPLAGMVLKNCVVVNGQTGSSAIVANDATTGAAGYFSDMTIQNNDVRKAFNGIFLQANSSPQGGSNVSVLDNKLDNTGANNIRLRGIYLQGINGLTVRGNVIANLSGTEAEDDQGMWLASGITNAVVEKNTIHSLNYTGTGGYGAHGIVVSTATTDADVLIKNNMIYNLSGDGWTFTGTLYTDNTMGMHFFSTQSGIKAYNNSIHLYGNTVNKADALSMGIALATGTTADVKNNIVVNNLGLLAALGYGSTGYWVQSAGASTSDFNDVYVNPTGSGTKLIGQVGQTVGVGNYSTLPAWQGATSQDANSISADPLFVSNTDLHINNAVGLASPAANGGTSLSEVTDDFDGDTRTATPDMGADEFTLRAPVAFDVLTPANGATLQATNGTLTWENPAGSSFFDVFFDITPSPTAVLATNHVGTSIAYSGDGGTTYYWNVVAKNADSSTTSSNGPFSFETELVQLSLTATDVAFGNVVVGNVASDSVWIRNTGTVSLTVDSVQASGGEFSVLPGGPLSIAVGDSAGLEITFSPTATGAQAGNVVIYSGAASSPDSIALSGTGVLPGFLVDPASLDFGAIPVGSFAVDSLKVTNTGGLTLNVSAAGPDPQFAVVPNGPIAIAPGDSAMFYVTFSPATAGVKNGIIEFTHDAPSNPDTVHVTGEGLPLDPVFSANPTSLSFGTVVVGDFALDSIEVSNPGLGDLEITSASGPDPQFAVVPNAATITPGNSFTFFVTFAPASPGPKSGNIIFVHNAASSPDSVAVDGFGADSTNVLLLTVTPDSIISKDPVKGKLLKPVKRGKGLHPNWANLMDETVAQGGFAPGTSESDQAGGMVVGISHMFEAAPTKWKPVKDSAAVRGWVRLTKWNFAKNLGKSFNVLQKTLEDKTGKHDGAPRGLDMTTDGKNKPILKQLTKLVPKKHDNALFAELVALKLNIAMSQLGKTPAGFGDLIYDDDASVYDEMSIEDISAEADMMMTYWQGLSSTQYDNLYDVVKAINGAFTGSLDTISFNAGGKLQAHGKVAVGSISFLKLPTPFVPTRISPTTNETESEDELDFDDEEFEDSLTPVAAKLYQNYPNPFNPSTTISFRLRETSQVTIRIFNMLGQHVATLMDGEELEEGLNTVQFAAGQLSSGVYFYQIHALGLDDETLQTVASKKMVLLK